MGFEPNTGRELIPVSKDVVEQWNLQQRTQPPRVPKLVDPEKYVFFDPLGGDPLAWYWHSTDGSWKFYDGPGFQSQTGDQLKVATKDIVDAWKKDFASHKSAKCYVLSRDGKVTYGETPGVDSATGRQCRPVKPEMVERLRNYEAGKRPQRITDSNPIFFDLRSGEPIIWYYQSKDNTIEIFDLMGFEPNTGDELIPVSKDVVEQWKLQHPKQLPRVPKLCGGNRHGHKRQEPPHRQSRPHVAIDILCLVPATRPCRI